MDGPRSYMIEAVYSGDTKLVIEIINNGGNVNERSTTNHTPVFAAIERNDYDMLKILINAGGRVDVKGWYGDTPLSLAMDKAKHDPQYFNRNIITLINDTLNSYV